MSRIARWIPAVAVAAVTLGAVAVPVSANAAVSLDTKTPEQVLALVADSETDAFSGAVKTSSDLGLPSLPAASGGSESDDISSLLTLLSTPQTARVYVDGPTKARVQVLKQMAEQDVIRNGTDVWVYDSKKNTAVHSTLPARSSATPNPTAMTPSELARAIIAKLDGSTRLSVGAHGSVANRAVYSLVLKPKATGTLIGSVAIAVDAKTGLPLQVTATARGQKDPAFRIGFTNLVVGPPDSRLFTFTPPKSAKVTEKKVAEHSARPTAPAPETTKPTVVGTGWDAVVVSPADSSLTKLSSVKQFTQLTTAVAGGRVFHTALVNVLVTDDGRVLAGSVPTSHLQAVAASSTK
ncbi:MAG: outer-membrane lipoprotein carrier protein LolA [Lacisediminihabitans sp.]